MTVKRGFRGHADDRRHGPSAARDSQAREVAIAAVVVLKIGLDVIYVKLVLRRVMGVIGTMPERVFK